VPLKDEKHDEEPRDDITFMKETKGSTLFFLGGGVDWELLTWWDSARCGELQLNTPMSRGMSASLRQNTRVTHRSMNPEQQYY